MSKKMKNLEKDIKKIQQMIFYIDTNRIVQGQDALNNYYQAFNESDIVDFIENTILKGQDLRGKERIKFAKEVL